MAHMNTRMNTTRTPAINLWQKKKHEVFEWFYYREMRKYRNENVDTIGRHYVMLTSTIGKI